MCGLPPSVEVLSSPHIPIPFLPYPGSENAYSILWSTVTVVNIYWGSYSLHMYMLQSKLIQSALAF